jgi:hypothetical protein
MTDDIKRNADIMRAASQVLEILAPFNIEDRTTIIVGACMYGGVRAHMVEQLPDVSELMAKVKPRSDG